VTTSLVVTAPGTITTVGAGSQGNSSAGVDNGAETGQPWEVRSRITINRVIGGGCTFTLRMGTPGGFNDDRTGVKLLSTSSGANDHTYNALVGEEALNNSYAINVTPGIEHDVRAVCDAGIVSFYLDGVFVGDSPDQTGSVPSSTTLTVEASAGTGSTVQVHDVFRGTQE
jgi:hypothetical protein